MQQTAYPARVEHDRKKIAIRLLFTILFFIIFEVIKTVIQLAALIQYGFLLITRQQNETVRKFSNKVVAYAYRVTRYATLCENGKPFPFRDFPGEVEPPENPVSFD